jgi:predicted nucleic acid-binding protein
LKSPRSMRNSHGLPFLDANIIIRLLTGDDPEKQRRARELFKRIEAGDLTLALPATVIFECIFTLTSPRLYRLPKQEAVALLLPLLKLPHLKVENRQTVLRAADLYATTPLSFGGAYIAAGMEQAGSDVIYSYDKGFGRLKGTVRKEP